MYCSLYTQWFICTSHLKTTCNLRTHSYSCKLTCTILTTYPQRHTYLHAKFVWCICVLARCFCLLAQCFCLLAWWFCLLSWQFHSLRTVFCLLEYITSIYLHGVLPTCTFIPPTCNLLALLATYLHTICSRSFPRFPSDPWFRRCKKDTPDMEIAYFDLYIYFGLYIYFILVYRPRTPLW